VAESTYPFQDPSLLCDVPPEAKVFRSHFDDVWARWKWLERARFLWRLAPRVAEMICFPDPWVGWVPHAVRLATEVIRSERPDIIVSTSAPYSTHLVAIALKQTFQLPWVADFRDEWSENPYANWSIISKYRHRRIEQQVLQSADKVVSVTPGITEGLQRLSGKQPCHFVTIPNGYDAEDFGQGEGAGGKRQTKFRVSYAGTFYGSQQPDVFLNGLLQAIAEERSLINELQFVVAGKHDQNSYLDKFPYQSMLQKPGYLPHHEAVHLMQNSDLLLLVIPRQRGNDCFTGKLFEYLAAGQHILALVPPESIAARLIQQAKAGWVVDPDDVDGITKGLLHYYRLWQKGIAFSERDWSVVEGYSRRSLTGQLAEMFEELLRPPLSP